MMEELKRWLDEKSIKYGTSNIINIINIDGFGDLLFIEGVDGKLIGDDYQFLLTDDEYELIEEGGDIQYLAFKWGTKFYYSELELKKSEYGESVYEPVFNDLNNIGSYQSDFNDLDFVNLGVHTGYELLNGSGEAVSWVDKASFYNHDVIGICEKDTLAGTLPFQLACKKKGLRCVLGQTISVAVNYDGDKEFQEVYDLKLYVKSKIGWRNLLNISKLINVDYKGFIPEGELLKRTEGLVAVFATDSYLNKILDNKKRALKLIKVYKKYFGADSLYYQLDCTEYADDQLDIGILNNIKLYLNNYRKLLKPVLISDAYYIERSDFKVKGFLNQINKIPGTFSDEQYYKDADDIVGKFLPLFRDGDDFNAIITAIKNTRKIADLCSYNIDTGNHKLPLFEVDNPEKLYDDLIAKGFQKKVLNKHKDKLEEYLNRVDEENDVIKGAGFINYFLILWDIVRWAKENDILVGPARGSAGGSLVAYLLGITEIDPIQYNLLFERFMNKARLSGERAKSADALPDIDVDFEGSRRQEVKRYIEEKYGFNYVCSIGTYTRLKTKSALKDFGRIKGLGFADINFATKQIPDSHDPNWSDIFRSAVLKPPLMRFVQDNLDICETIKAPLGQPRSGSIHPSAVLIVPKEDDEGNKMEIYDWMPIKEMNGELVSEWEGKYIDAAGFLKEDILGIAQLDKFKKILNLIKENKGKRVNLNKIPIDKKEVMLYFKKGWNEDVFQFGTSGLKNYSKKVKPDGMEDLISMNALFRPGPMDSRAHDQFVAIKHGKKKPEFDYMLSGVTKNTFGLYIYQEQIMEAVHVLGNLTLAEADELRTAIKKFDHKKMASAKAKFLRGAKSNGCEKDEAKLIWEKLNAFSAYGFNRSHSAAYSLMGYWCQYLKVKYPLEFWTASLNFADEKTEIPDRLSEIEKIRSNISVKPPSVNKSDFSFTSEVETNSIYWSMTKIKGVGEVAAKKIIECRNDGEFFSLDDFLNRVPKAKVNKRVVQVLIMAGAFDEIGGENSLPIDEVCQRLNILEKHAELVKCELPKDILESKATKRNWFWSVKQKELTGFGYIDFMSLIRRKNVKLKHYPYITGNDFDREVLNDGHSWKPERTGSPYTVAGRLYLLKEKKSKNQNWIVRMILENNNSFIHLGVFGEIYDKFRDDLMRLQKSKTIFCVNGYGLDTRPKGKKKDDTDSNNNELWLTKKSKLIELN